MKDSKYYEKLIAQKIQEEEEEYRVLLKEAKEVLEGKKIINIRYASTEELVALGWSVRFIVLELEDDIVCYPVRDSEGKDGGLLFAIKNPKYFKEGEDVNSLFDEDKDGEEFYMF